MAPILVFRQPAALDITSLWKFLSSTWNLNNQHLFLTLSQTAYLGQRQEDSPSIMTCAHPVSAAKLFVQLAPSRTSLPVLDFLLPKSRAIATTSRQAFQSSLPKTAKPQALESQISQPKAEWRIRSSRVAPRRAALSTPAAAFRMSMRRYTQAAYNAQQDDDGIEMKLEITPRAAKVRPSPRSQTFPIQARKHNANASHLLSRQRLSDIMAKDANPHLALRIQVESGGCHGFQYLMSLVTLPAELPATRPAAEDADAGADSDTVREDDTILTYSAEEEAGDAAALADLTRPKIILDTPSLELLKGSKVDYTMELIGSQFKIVDNPMATSSCGCGTSFDLKAL